MAASRPNAASPLVRRVLRVHPEPCQHIGDWQVHRALTADPGGYVSYVEDQLELIAAGTLELELPPKQIFGDQDAGGGDFRLMPCVTRGRAGCLKTVKLVGTNLVQRQVPDQITVGKAYRLDPLENYITHGFDACLLSSARTGACVALAVRHLASRCRQVALIGCGRVGYYSALYVSRQAGVEHIVVADRARERAEDLAGAVRPHVGDDVRLSVAAGDDVRTSDVVILATPSRRPLLAPGDTTANLVVSAGADSAAQHELDPGWASVADIYVDTLDSLAVGDMAAWQSSHGVTVEPVGDIVQLVRDGPRPLARGQRRTRVFISSGSALFDNLTISYLLRPGSSLGPPV